jgi:PTH1 family peptidyl-tRNA hydrolase
MKWVVGLGNPGKSYQNNRHNVGFMCIDRLADKHNIVVTQNKFKAIIGEGFIGEQKVALIKPQTYMNLSGESLRAFLDYTKSTIDEGIIVYDDLDTVFGQVRLRYQGSPGGHNGIKSIVQHLGTQSFNRVRVGISRPAPGYDIADYVLANFNKLEFEQLSPVLDRTIEAIEYALEQPFDKAMAKFNDKKA